MNGRVTVGATSDQLIQLADRAIIIAEIPITARGDRHRAIRECFRIVDVLATFAEPDRGELWEATKTLAMAVMDCACHGPGCTHRGSLEYLIRWVRKSAEL